jgi:hypothetical protein
MWMRDAWSPGFRREARLTPGYGRRAFQAEEVPRPNACSRLRVGDGCSVERPALVLRPPSSLLSPHSILLSGEARLTPGYGRTAFQADEERPHAAAETVLRPAPSS